MTVLNSEKFESTVLNGLYNYYVVEELPTNFRSYYNVDKVYVRGLFYEESLALSKYMVSLRKGVKENFISSLSTLVTVYSDVIKGIAIEDLEVSDFLALLSVSTIWTSPDFTWIPNSPCTKYVENPLITSIKEQIKLDPESENLSDLKLAILNLDQKVPCDGTVDQPVTLDDLEFKDPIMCAALDLPLGPDNKEHQVTPITVGDLLEASKFQRENPDIDAGIVQFASMISTQIPIEEKVRLIRTSTPAQIKDLAKLESDFFIKIEPLDLKCSSCGQTNKVNLGLDMLQAYP